MSPVLGDADKLYVGSQLVDKAYVGAVRVYPKFLPPDLTGLVVWLDAEQVVGADAAAVSSWPNLASGGTAVTLVSTAPTKRLNILNGKPVVRFVAGSYFTQSTTTGNPTTEYTNFVVAHMTGPNYRRIFGSQTYNILVGWWGGYQDKMYIQNWSTPDPATAVTTAWKMYSIDGTGTATRLFSNGVAISTLASAGTWGGTFSIGSALNEPSDCEVAELIMYNRKLADVDRQRVEAYLRKKWGFP